LRAHKDPTPALGLIGRSSAGRPARPRVLTATASLIGRPDGAERQVTGEPPSPASWQRAAHGEAMRALAS